jgi:hypothetical protein
LFNAITKHFQSEGIPEKLADYMSHNLTIQIHQSAKELADILREEFGEPTVGECGCNDICPDCQEAEMKAMLHQDIADACDLPIELVNRVLAGQDEVLGME